MKRYGRANLSVHDAGFIRDKVGIFNMIKFLTKTALVATIAGLALASTPALAAPGNPATADGTAKVRILQPLSIDATGGLLDFGVLVKSSGVAPASIYVFDVSTTGVFGGCDAAWACSAAKQAATFVVTGAADESVQVSIPTAAIDLDGGVNPYLSLALKLSNDGDSDGDANYVLNTGVTLDQATFTVGGTLSVRGDVPPGTYTQTFTVSAEYL